MLDVNCGINCKECNSDSECIDCENSLYNLNYTNYHTGTLYCSHCKIGCFSCWGPDEFNCHCHENQFGYANSAAFNSEFHLCLRSLTCPENCSLCSLQFCLECSKNYFLDLTATKCLPVNTRSCAIYKENQPYHCLECVQGYFLTENNYCKTCPSNCLHCNDFSTCFVCENNYRKYLNKCISYSPQLFIIFEKENINSQTNAEFQNIYRITYDVKEFYDFEKNKVVDYSYFDEIYSKSMEPMTEKQYSEILDNYILEDCDQKLSKNCIFLKSKKFQVKTILHKKKDENEDTNCLRFKRTDQCSECVQNYYLDVVTKKCVKNDLLPVKELRYNKVQSQYQPYKCAPNYFLIQKTKKCVQSISKCLTLTKEGKCSLCKPGFFQSLDKTSCLKCPDNCVSCIDSNQCTECIKSHFLTFDKGKQLINTTVTKGNNQNTCQPCVFPCLECLSASFCKVCHPNYERYSKNTKTKLCRIICNMSKDFIQNNQCVKCSKCDFCQIGGKPKCVNCPQCKSKCKFTVSEELHIPQTSISYFYIDTPDFILENPKTLMKIPAKVEISKQTQTRYKIFYNEVANDETVSFFFDPSSVSSVSCVYNFEEPLVLTFTRKTQNIIGLNPENLVSAISSVKLSALLAQLKANSGYYLIELINLNKVANYLFILDH